MITPQQIHEVSFEKVRRGGYDMDAVVHWLRTTVGVPVVTGLPYGHVKTKATLPVGQTVGIATEDDMAHLVLQEHF